MHAVVVDVVVEDPDRALEVLHERVIPFISQVPGFVSGIWLKPKDGVGQSIVVFESEEAALAMAERRLAPEGFGTVRVQNVEVRAVAAHA